jgi:hypothetical protein
VGLEVAKRTTWVVDVSARPSDFDPWEDATLIDSDGRVLHTIELENARDYVVPITFDACWDDPDYPAEVTLEVEVGISAGAVVRSIRIDPRPAKTREGYSAWPLQGMSSYERLGRLPELPVPSLLREALAHAAMPRSRPLISEMGWHAVDLLQILPIGRAPRLPNIERERIWHYYAQAIADTNLMTELDQREWIFKKLHEENPEVWRYSEGNRSTADYDRLRSFLDEAEAKLERVGSRSLEPGSFTLPSVGWTSGARRPVRGSRRA